MGDQMDENKLDIIKQLMEELVGEMEPSKEDYDMRLGKPKVEVMKIGAESPEMSDSPDMDGDEDKMGHEMGDDQDEGMDHMDMVMDPEEKLKARIMRLKG